jgi:hypothetical protein
MENMQNNTNTCAGNHCLGSLGGIRREQHKRSLGLSGTRCSKVAVAVALVEAMAAELAGAQQVGGSAGAVDQSTAD